MSTPNTLPADFFDKPKKETAPKAPDSLPADFFDKKADAPASVKIPNFPFDQHIQEQTKNLEPKQRAETQGKFAYVMHGIAQPWLAEGYSAAEALNRGCAHIFDSLDAMSRFVEKHTGLSRGGFFEDSAKFYEDNADFWKKRADQVGINFLEELIGQAVGGAVPGAAEFALDMDSGLTIPAVVGAQKSEEQGKSSLVGGLVEAGKTGTLAYVMRMAEPFSRAIKATVMGTAGGVIAESEAPEGKKLEAFVKGAAPMAAFGAMSPGGYTLSDVWPEIGKNGREFRSRIAKEETTPMEDRNLRPALQSGDQIITGEPGESHPDVIARQQGLLQTDIPPVMRVSELPTPLISERASKVQTVPSGSAVQDLWTFKTPKGGTMEVEFFDDHVRIGQVRGMGGGDASAMYERLGHMMRDRGIPGSAIEGDIEGPPEAIKKLRAKAAMIAGEGRITEARYDIDVEPGETTGLQLAFDLGAAGRGFADPEGNFLSREEAKAWVKENQPQVYAKWAAKMGDENAEFHSQDYAEAAGISHESPSLIPGDPDIGQLTSRLRQMPKSADLKERIQVAENEAKSFKEGALAKVKTAWSNFKAITASIHDQFTVDPKSTDLKKMTGEYLGDRQISSMKVGRWAEAIQNMYLDKKRNTAVQEAMTKYIRAGGDRNILEQAAAELENVNPNAALKYRNALNLNDEEITLANNIGIWYEAMLDRAINNGILKAGLEDYVNRRYKTRPNPTNDAGAKLIAQADGGMLQKNPSFAKKRFYEFDIEAERQGADLEDRIGYLLGAYENSMNEAIAARSFVRKLIQGTMEDGRPIGVMLGGGHRIAEGEEPPSAYIINPSKRPKPKEFRYKGPGEEYPSETDFGDYRVSNNAALNNALRNHVWAGADQDGNPIYLRADMALHPDALKYLENVFGQSKLREIPVTKAMLTGAGEIKGMMLSLSPFHQVGIGQEMLYHGANPFAPPEINLEEPIVKEAVEHGLNLYDQRGMEFMEGATGPGLLKYIPKVGKTAQGYTDYLFGLDGYLPRSKVLLYKEILPRNLERYSNTMSRDDICFKTASQVNAITGGINYRLMGRNQTFQDILRLVTLAPDFLEARITRGVQAARPGGKEQATAIIASMFGMYGAAKIIEGIFHFIDSKNEVHWDRPFSVTVDGKEYSLRSWIGDFYHLLKDQRSFIYYRLNPAYTRPIQWALTGRDEFGRPKNFSDMATDTIKRWLPIPGQGLFTKKDFTIWQSMLQSLGISSWQYRTDAETLMRQKQMAKAGGESPGETVERRKSRSQLTEDFAKSRNPVEIRKALIERKITAKDAEKIFTTAIEGDLRSGIKGLTLPESLEIWDAANEKEKGIIRESIVSKWLRWDATPDERSAFEKKMEEIRVWKPGTKKRFSILK